MKKIAVLGLLCTVALVAFFNWKSPGKAPTINENKLRIGVVAGPHATIMDHVSKMAKKDGLTIDVVEFNDFLLPNAALDQGEIDVNCYQHKPFLDEQIKSRGYKIQSLAQSVLMPMGIYSNKIKDLGTLSVGSKIGIPNDPTNGGRALLLLQKAGVITLKASTNPSVLDIDHNPKSIKIVELEAPHLPRSLDDLDAAVINTDWIVVANINPKSTLFNEDRNSPYMNIIAVRKGDEKNPTIQKFVALYQSPETKDFIDKEFKGVVIPGW
ncbi:MAG: MetQ/NlpA family ABC transporter substrate-binding protein [Alphaproteobacteria bacterium]|nr:MetQ/NlpA family ABC transporter substrate-binding protein [Alphaproteobacteria bacterium]